MYGIVYKIINKINKKIYIGMTTYTLEKRWKGHCSDAKYQREKKLFYYDIVLFGVDNFYKEEIESLETAIDLSKSERYWIAFYNSTDENIGYNISPGYGMIKESTKIKMSEAQKGEKNHMFGKSPSPETRKKISEAQKGKVISEETRKKISEAEKGKIVSDETRKKMSDNHADCRGEKNSFYGKHHTEENKQKLRESRLGKKHSEETKQKLREISSGVIQSKEIIMKKSGENSSLSKLTWKCVDEIRENKNNLSVKELSIKYNVCKSSIRNVLSNKTWNNRLVYTSQKSHQ